jgi:release factor glutamine methyltransferase
LTAAVPNIAQLLHQARTRLRHGDSGALDAEVLLAHVLNKPRSHLHAWPEAEVHAHQAAAYRRLLARRARGEPVAYLTGQREFWSLAFTVSEATLIPRPESELLVEQALALLPADRPLRIADLGTGSGILAVTIARERNAWQVYASDRSTAALAVARRNAARLGTPDIAFLIGNWAESFGDRSLDAIVSNPPYVPEQDPHLVQGDVRFEPRSALTAGRHGLDHLAELTGDATRVLKPGGWLFLEHAPDQTTSLQRRLNELNFLDITTLRDLAGQDRVTRAHKFA